MDHSDRLRAVEALEGNLKTLDQEYNSLSDHMAKGEQEDFSPEWLDVQDIHCII